MLHWRIFRELRISSENRCSLFRYLQYVADPYWIYKLGKVATKTITLTYKMYWVQHSYIIFSLWLLWHSWLWQLYKNLCSRCAQRCVDLNVESFLTDFNRCWNAPLNSDTPPQYKIWQKSARSRVLSCAWTDRGVFLNRWPTKLQIHL